MLLIPPTKKTTQCRDRQDTCDATVAGLPAELKAKLKFVVEDIGDVDLQQLLSSVDFEGLIIFSNDLAFNQGLIKRQVILRAA